MPFRTTIVSLCLGTACAGGDKGPGSQNGSETGADSGPVEGDEDSRCAAQLAALDGVEVAPSRVFPACAEPTGRAYVDVAADWGLIPPTEPGDSHNSGGVVAVEDYNGDGIPDVVFGYEGSPLVHFVGTGGGFDATTLTGTTGSGPIVNVDVDSDGDMDVLVVGPPPVLLENDGGRLVVSPLLIDAGVAIVDLSPADFDGDGVMDLYAASAGIHDASPERRADHLFVGDGLGNFTASDLSLPDAGGLGFDSLAGDLNADGWPDVYTVNDFGTSLGSNVLWHNSAGALLSQNDVCACDLAISGMGVDMADMNGDGLPELLIASTGANHLLQQQGDGVYVDIARSTGADALSGLPTMAWGQIFFDHDDNGLLDLLVAEGDLWLASTDPELRTTYDAPIHLMENRGTRTAPSFVDIADAVGLGGTGSWRSVVPADFDGDGAEDLLITDIEAPPRLMLATGCTGHGAFEVDAPLHTRVEACIGGERHVSWVRTESGWGGSRPLQVRLGTGTHPIPETVVLVPPPGVEL